MHSGVKVIERVERGCGFRKIHGLYLCGSGIHHECDRLDLVIEACEICGERPRFSRSIQKINPFMLFGLHLIEVPDNFIVPCECPETCPVCYPSDTWNTYLMWVGRDYTMEGFIEEAVKMGVSKRIPFIPKDMIVGRDWVFLARKNGGKDLENPVIGRGRPRMADVVFYAFRPSTVEYIINEEEAEANDFIEDLISRGVTPVLEK